jgi:hypothetical protein
MLSQRCHSSKHDGAAGLQRLRCGVRQRQCLDPSPPGCGIEPQVSVSPKWSSFRR